MTSQSTARQRMQPPPGGARRCSQIAVWLLATGSFHCSGADDPPEGWLDDCDSAHPLASCPGPLECHEFTNNPEYNTQHLCTLTCSLEKPCPGWTDGACTNLAGGHCEPYPSEEPDPPR